MFIESFNVPSAMACQWSSNCDLGSTFQRQVPCLKSRCSSSSCRLNWSAELYYGLTGIYMAIHHPRLDQQWVDYLVLPKLFNLFGENFLLRA